MPNETAADRALRRSEARGEIRKMLTETSSAGQVRIARERGKQRRSAEKVRTQQRILERQQSEAARVGAYAQRAQIAQQQKEHARQQRIQTQQDLMALKASTQPSTISNIGSSIGGSVTGSSAWSTLMTVTALFFIMIFAYILVRNGAKFSAFTGKVGTFIASLSSTQPIFVSSP